MPQEITVRLFGTPMELAKATEMKVKVSATTPIEIIREVAQANKMLANSIIRADGAPRLSTKILVDGHPPASLNDPIPQEAVVTLGIMMPCDG